MDKSIYLASFTLVEAPYLAGINIRDALLQNIMIMTIYCMSCFTAIQARYTHLDTLIPVLQQLQPWIDLYICTVDALKII